MNICSLPPRVLAALTITRIVDGRCNSLENPGTTIHPGLILFGRGRASTEIFVLDHGVMQTTTLIMSGGAWSVRLDATVGSHSFSVCARNGAMSQCWDVTVEASPPIPPPTFTWVSPDLSTGSSGDPGDFMWNGFSREGYFYPS